MKLLPTVLANLFSRPATRDYPEYVREPFAHTRGELVNDISRCIFCGTCARKCPSQCLTVAKDSAKAFIVATEAGILHQMRQRRPEAELIPAPADSGCNCSLCPYMKLNSLEKLYLCMRDRTPEITLDEELRLRALKPVQRMLALS